MLTHGRTKSERMFVSRAGVVRVKSISALHCHSTIQGKETVECSRFLGCHGFSLFSLHFNSFKTLSGVCVGVSDTSYSSAVFYTCKLEACVSSYRRFIVSQEVNNCSPLHGVVKSQERTADAV
jgi:hypothetical protein